MWKLWGIAGVAIGLAWGWAAAQAAPAEVVLAAESCGACHGDGGVSAGPTMPSLAGQPKAYFVTAMQRFKSGERPSTVMGRLARGYTDAEIDAMGAWFAARKPVAASQPLDAALVKRGMQVYFKQCRTCHLDGSLWRQIHQYRTYEKTCSASCHANYGSDTADEVPLIGGQWVGYLNAQMDDFRRHRRPMSPRKAKAVDALSDQDAAAVAAFYASLKELQR
ncbi:MAG: c-type cytochrome [Actinomycetota bacterium]